MGKYDDIINLPYPASSTRARMPLSDRAAQFAPFAALSGYDAAIRETARLTDEWVELDETKKADIDLKIRELLEQCPNAPLAVFTYFQPDPTKGGGAYLQITGRLKKVNEINREIVLADGTILPIDSIFDITDSPV